MQQRDGSCAFQNQRLLYWPLLASGDFDKAWFGHEGAYYREILLFFDRHYPRGADGKLRLEPAQVLETWWIAVNPAPDVAGLRFDLDGLLAMNAGTAEDRTRWQKFRGEIPEVPMRTIDGRQAIAPAEKWEKQRNAENGDLYPVFPFRCFGLALGSGDIVAWTMKHRSCKDAFGARCWTQDQIDWACAGCAAEARDGLVRRFRTASPMCRFPLYGREGPDSCPVEPESPGKYNPNDGWAVGRNRAKPKEVRHAEIGPVAGHFGARSPHRVEPVPRAGAGCNGGAPVPSGAGGVPDE